MSTAIRSLLRLRGRRVRLCFAFQVFEYLSAMRLNVARIGGKPNPTEIRMIDFYVNGAVGVVFWVSVFDHYEILNHIDTLSAGPSPPPPRFPISRHVPDTFAPTALLDVFVYLRNEPLAVLPGVGFTFSS